MGLFEFSLKLNGFKIGEAQEVFSKIKNLNGAEHYEYLENKKREILGFHLNHNSFYKSLGKSIDLNHWDSVPVLTKAHLQQPIENRLSEGYSKKDVYINKTSGSSGHPFIFAKDKWCHALTWAEIMDRFSWYHLNFNSSRQARFYGIPLDAMGYYKERLKDFLSNRYRFSIFDLSDEALDKVLKKFKRSSFKFINGYTSSIVQFAKYLQRKNIVLRDVCPSLKVCIVTAEMLFENDKVLLEKQFGVPIINEYGASELGLIAFQNPQGEWQVNSESLFVEILDEQNNPVPYGQKGKVVITSLYNKAHPFIRYEIGDIGQLTKESTPNKPILEFLIGRTNDVALLPSGKKAAGLTFYYVTKSVIENDGNVSEFIIEQNSLDRFNIKYVAQQKLSKQEKEVVIKAMVNYLEPGVSVEFEKLDQLKRSKSGKLKQFQSNLNP